MHAFLFLSRRLRLDWILTAKVIAIIAMGLGQAGCGGPRGDYSLVELVKARGNVTLDGSPLEGAVVIFEDLADGTFSYGMTDKQGNYVLQFDSEMQGVKVGEKVIRISTSQSVLGLNALAADEGGDPDAKPQKQERVPARFNKNSELSAKVTSGKSQYDFQIDSK